MKKVLAVSGGVDSVVMLHLFRDDDDVIVAHFDHGIRPNSAEDCAFVQKLAAAYQKPFVFERAELGPNCSEDKARTARYAFLNRICSEQNGQIYTAHHADDMAESVAINLIRGTNWRGLAPLSNPEIQRPLLKMRKSEIYQYAAKYNLSFQEDQTNNDDQYLRNRVRHWFIENDDDGTIKNELIALAERQSEILAEFNGVLAANLASGSRQSKDIFDGVNDVLALELLRQILQASRVSLTYPQLARCLVAIKTFQPGKKFSLNKTHFVKIGRYYFEIG